MAESLQYGFLACLCTSSSSHCPLSPPNYVGWQSANLLRMSSMYSMAPTPRMVSLSVSLKPCYNSISHTYCRHVQSTRSSHFLLWFEKEVYSLQAPVWPQRFHVYSTSVVGQFRVEARIPAPGHPYWIYSGRPHARTEEEGWGAATRATDDVRRAENRKQFVVNKIDCALVSLTLQDECGPDQRLVLASRKGHPQRQRQVMLLSSSHLSPSITSVYTIAIHLS